MDMISKKIVKNLFKEYQIKPSKNFGQNFLINEKAIQKIIEAADIQSRDIILEIGPGIGAITQELAKKAKKVIAVEKDPKMVQILKETLQEFKNVEVIQNDILKLIFKLPHSYKIVANLPFYLTPRVIRKFLEIPNPPKEMILIVQKEVAQRICAKPPKMNLLAVSVQIYADAEIISYISKKSFWPQPKVDSAIIKITSKGRSVLPRISGGQTSTIFFGIVKAGFAQPRKTILNNLKNGLKLDKDEIEKWLVENNIQLNQRAETLSVQDWLNLTKTLKNYSIIFFGKEREKGIAPLIIIGVIAVSSILAGSAAMGWLDKTGMQVLDALIASFFILLQSVGTIFLSTAGILLSWVISPDFINISFTTNPFVQTGWSIVRDFANMFFILVLVVIGLATALRYKEYEAKKTLPLLILIALLINFTPVICGFVIDASNIAMNFFLSEVGSGLGSAIEKLGQSWDKYAEMIEQGTKPTAVAGYGFTMAIFTFVTAFIYLIFALLFMVRYVALWTLVILSPIAFFCYILPATKKAWDTWWQQFIQWCIVGVIGAFFLYMAEIMNSQFVDLSISAPVGLEGEPLNAITSFFPFLVPIIFLIIGLFVTLSSSATGASFAISGAAKTSKFVGAKAFKAAKETKIGQKMEGWTREKMEKIPGMGKPGEYRMETEKKREEMRKDMERYTKEERTEIRKRRTTPYQEKIAANQVALENNEIEDTEEKRRTMLELKSAGVNLSGTIEKMPDLAGIDGIRKSGQTEAQAIQEQVQKTTPLKFRQETKAKALENLEVVMAMDKAKLQELGRRGSQEQKNAVRDNVINNYNEIKARVQKLKQSSKKIEQEKGKQIEDFANAIHKRFA
jgi:16S rRNA (adenine1518-N6/adenine1519-N6)-dimethyltransferase